MSNPIAERTTDDRADWTVREKAARKARNGPQQLGRYLAGARHSTGRKRGVENGLCGKILDRVRPDRLTKRRVGLPHQIITDVFQKMNLLRRH